MLFARFDWSLNLGISSGVHLLAASRGNYVVQNPCHQKIKYYLGIANKLVLYILKQLFASVSVNNGGYLPCRSGSVNITAIYLHFGESLLTISISPFQFD